jgi:hypothetical protein
MSQEINQPGMPSGSSPTPQKKKQSSIIYWVVIGVLLIVCIYLGVTRQKAIQGGQQTAQQLDSVITEKDTLQQNFDAASQKIDQLMSENVKMDSAMQGSQKEIFNLKAQIKSILSNSRATADQLKHARELISELKGKTRSYEERITELEKENASLTSENKVLAQERDSTVTRNIALKKVGSVLHASNIRMEPLHRKNNGREKETTKARRVDLLRITFDIDENRIADDGTKQLYLRISGPDGNILSNAGNNSGWINLADGTSVNYSVLREIPLTKGQPVKDITVDWNQTGDYQRGSYTIDIYNEGYKIGSGSVTLR